MTMATARNKPPITEPTEIPAIAPFLRPLLVPEGEEVASGFDDVGVVVEADAVGPVSEEVGEEVGEEDVW